jgi:DUF4097 and DUF4098 domain-containing protein YvlB
MLGGVKRLIFAVTLFAMLAACGHGRIAVSSVFTHTSTTTTPISGGVTSLVVDADNGNIDVQTGPASNIRRTEHWSRSRPTVTVSESGGVLTVISRCPRALVNRCYVDIVATVPVAAAARVTTTNGNLNVRDLGGPSLRARTTNGNVEVSAVSSSEIDCASTNGNVELSMLRSQRLRCVTKNGNIDASLGPVTDVTLTTTNGNIDARLPAGAYYLDAATTNGRVSKDGITSDPTSAHRVSAHATNGNVTLTESVG